MAAAYVSSAEDAKDIYQEVFLRVYKALPKFQFRSEFSTWLHRITANVCLSHRSRRKRHVHVSLDQELEAEDSQPPPLSHSLRSSEAADQPTLNAEIALHVEEALNTLSTKQKLVFTLKHYQGYKIKEIASMMDCKEGTVKKNLFTATQQLRKQLKDIF